MIADARRRTARCRTGLLGYHRRVRRLTVCLVLAACGADGAALLDGGSDTVDAASGSCVPRTGWTTAPKLARGKTQETAAVALAGKLYVLGGFDDQAAVLDTVQVFDTRACTWAAGPVLPRAVHHANAAVVGDTIWIVGAMETLSFTPVAHVWSWKPASETGWTQHAAMPGPRGSAITGVIGGVIYLAGGLRGGTAVVDVSSFDPATGTWDATLPPLPESRDHGCGGAVGGKLYVTGGRRGGIGTTSPVVSEYTPAGGWVTKAPMPTARGGTACGVIADRIYVVGGEGNPATSAGVFAQVEAYAPASDTWVELAPMPVPRHGMGAAVLEGALWVPGGATKQGFGADDTVDAFVP